MKTKIIFYYILFSLVIVNSSSSQTLINGIINSYYQVVQLKDSNSIFVNDATGLNISDHIIIIQMKGAVIDTSNSPNFGDIIDIQNTGNFELHQIDQILFNQIITKKPLKKQFSISGLVQVIKVITLKSAKVVSELTCKEWDGKTGGVLALMVEDTLFLEDNINTSYKGFRGGQIYNPPGGWNGSQKEYYYAFPTPYGARKGEGITYLGEDKICGRGKLANGGGGGNDHNAGGGGGSNADTGGRGGNQWLYSSPGDYHTNGGHGGVSLYNDSTNFWCRVFLGGGGGAGHENQNGGTAGGNGGGIIFLKAKSIKSFSGIVIQSNGENVPVTPGPDAAGGGGGGGTVILDVDSFNGDLNIEVIGGNGGNASHNIRNTCHGPGGGGSGGIVLLKQSILPSNIVINTNGGSPGVFVDPGLNCTGSNWGATAGGNGKVVLNFNPDCIYPVSLKDSCFSAIDFPNFFNVKDLNIMAHSFRKDSIIRLTDTRVNQTGAVWFTKKVNVAEGFSTKFAFRFSDGTNNNCNDNSLPGADGLAFVIQNYSNLAFGLSGGGLGYDGIPNSIAVEFDTFNNDSTQIENLFDPNGNHIAVQSCGESTNTAKHNEECNIAINSEIFPLRSNGKIYYAKIDYNIGNKKFVVYLDSLPLYRFKLIELDNFDISKKIKLEQNKLAYVGFTAATGCAVENHDLLHWDFCTMAKNISDVDFEYHENTELSFDVIPNPVQDEISIKLNSISSQILELEVFNQLGQRIYKENIKADPQQIIRLKFEVSEVPTGFYFCKVSTATKTKIEKFIITK